MSELRPLEEREIVQLPTIPHFAQSNYHLFHILLPSVGLRDSLMMYLRERGIGATFHFVPLHSSPMGRKLGWNHNDCPLTQEYSSRLLRLPLYHSLSTEEQEYVIDSIHSWAKVVNLQRNIKPIFG
jgi:dTDP-4-amino-4,6-dideoxygalactose transaminase